MDNKDPLSGPVAGVYLRWALPSVFGLLSISTAALVDGIFIGNYAGAEALAAVNLIMPFLSLLFALGLMLGVGGSVRAGKYLGEQNDAAASAVFSKTMIVIAGLAMVVLPVIWWQKEAIFFGLGATPPLIPMMDRYLGILLIGLGPQIVMIVLYFFVKVDGNPGLASAALLAGSLSNIVFDALFIAWYGMGVAGAAWATNIAQFLQLIIMSGHFLSRRRRLHWQWPLHDWREVLQGTANGISEFINEISGGLVTFVVHWLLVLRVGVPGVAAYTVANYFMFFGMITAWGLSDAMQVVISQNYGARQAERIRQVLKIATLCNLLVAGVLVTALLVRTGPMVALFLPDGEKAVLELAESYIYILWPILFTFGLNGVASGYFTAIHRPVTSGFLSIMRALILPGTLLGLFSLVETGFDILWALPLAGMINLIMAALLILANPPSRVIRQLIQREGPAPAASTDPA